MRRPSAAPTRRSYSIMRRQCCFEIAEGKAKVWLSYSRQKLKLDGDNIVIEGLADNKVIAALNHLRQAVESGVFDNQLEDIKLRRSAAQKASKVRAPKK